jgi:hypothetical protein
MANWTSSQDVLDIWAGDNKPEDIELINALINKAEVLVLAEYPKIQDRIDAGTLNEQLVIYVVCEMVEAVLRNPNGQATFSYTTGPFAESGSYANGAKDIHLTQKQKELLAPTAQGRAYQVDLQAGSNAAYDAAGIGYVGSYWDNVHFLNIEGDQN